MKRLIFLAVLGSVLLGFEARSQSVDEDRMNRDIKVAENILSTLINEQRRENTFVFGWDRDVQGTYIPEYGVIFNIKGGGFVIGSPEVLVDAAIAARDDKEDKDDDEQVIVEELELGNSAKLKEAMTTFLADYGDLIGQLQPDHKIMVSWSRENNAWTVSGDNMSFGLRPGVKRSVTAEVKKTDLNSFRSGKINRKVLVDKIVITENDKDAPVDRDLELFASIFERLLKQDLSDTYYISGSGLIIDRIKEFGVIYNMKVYSSYLDGKRYYMPTIDDDNLTKDERNKRVEEMYPDFERMIIENLADYSRTLKSLDEDEIVMLKIKLTECEGCKIPEAIDVSLKVKDIIDYNDQKINRDQLISRITLKKY